ALGVFLDGVYQSRAGATPSMYDLERVEVVKGPQGTLFGRNTASGAISMVSRKPGDSFAGEVSVGAGQFGRQDFEGSLDMPLSENLAVRIAGIHQREDGRGEPGRRPRPGCQRVRCHALHRRLRWLREHHCHPDGPV
ncbi:TonB-dependent receptor plug domain-containing protein, partial [Microbulbifer taiwanensis]